MRIKYEYSSGTLIRVVMALFLSLLTLAKTVAQDAAPVPSEQLPSVQVQAPSSSGSSRGARSEEGFGYGDPVPAGQAFSDYAPTRSEVVSESGRTQTLQQFRLL